MKTALTPFLIACETIAFCVLIGILYFFSDRNSYLEDSMIREVTKKSDINQTVVDYSQKQNALITGAAVLSEIKTFDGNIMVYLDSTNLNEKQTVTGDLYFDYVKKYGYETLYQMVSITRYYERTCTVDEEGNLTAVTYKMTNNSVE